MFKKIIGQENFTNLLINDINSNSLSNSMIFVGEKYTGRLSSALEFVRIINCLNDKSDDCQCNNCKRIKELNFEGLLLLSRRDYSNLLKEFINIYNKNQAQNILDEIKRIIKLFSLPLQDFLIKDIFNEQDKKEIYNALDQANDILLNNKFSSLELEKILSIEDKIQDKYKKLNIPIDSLRAMIDWSYISNPDIKRVVIIDHVEYLERNSQNILLKRLEEPSLNLYFILICSNLNNIVKTILSRCRIYYLKKLTEEEVRKIIKINFTENVVDCNSIDDFVTRNDEKSRINILPVIIKLLNLVFLKDNPFNELSLFLSNFNDKKYVKAMLKETANLLEKEIAIRELGLDNETDLKMLKNISNFSLVQLKELIIKKYNDIDKFGLNPTLLLEGIFYPLKAMLENDKVKFS
jgi:DNA polymerase III delta prime subunit